MDGIIVQLSLGNAGGRDGGGEAGSIELDIAPATAAFSRCSVSFSVSTS